MPPEQVAVWALGALIAEAVRTDPAILERAAQLLDRIDDPDDGFARAAAQLREPARRAAAGTDA